MSENNVLVTGADGFVGSALSQYLREHHFSVITGTRWPVKSEDHETLFYGDITKRILLSGQSTLETVVHCVARVHQVNDKSKDPIKAFREVNVKGLSHMLDALTHRGLKRFIYLSTIKVMGEKTEGKAFSELDAPHPQNPYAQSKLEAEQLLMERAHRDGFEYVIIRPPLVYGEGAKGNIGRLFRWIEKGVPLPLASIDNKRSMISLQKLCQFISLCVTSDQAKNEIFHVSDGTDYSTPQFLRVISKNMSKQAKLFPFSQNLLKSVASLLGRGDDIERLCGSLEVDIRKAKLLNKVS